ncbi:MAG: V-type ATP synthase subunit D [Bacteroidota bacterium]
MADKILMNKNTLAALKAELVEYRGALPVFEMKEQQLKGIVQSIENGISILKGDIKKTNEQIKSWVAVMAEEGVDLGRMVKVEKVRTEQQEIAGIVVESYIDIEFAEAELDYFTTPLWADAAIEVVVSQKTKHTILVIEQRKLELLQEELAEARRMKNALKEVFIPETLETIRKIEIYLGDVERLAIGCAKLVKKKKMEKMATG